MEEKEKLQLRFDPRTIEHLGIKMYSRLPYALAELVANAYDAGAENVTIDLQDSDSNNKTISISDDGDGMTYDEVQEKFLVIGRKRRDSDESRENKGRKITGKKGVGKLALFGIGKTIKIITTVSGEKYGTSFVLDWDEITKETSGAYCPKSYFEAKSNEISHGTTIVLSNLTRVTGFDHNATAISLSKLFNCFDKTFKVTILHNGESPISLTRELKYMGLDKEFEWNVNDIISRLDSDYSHKNELKGQIISSKKPMKPDLRGITLYVNGRLANTPGYFGLSEAGHTFSYLSGWIDADFLDEFENDLISTDRQSLSWDLPEAEELQTFLQQIVRFLVKDWSAKRKKAKEEKNTRRSGVNLHEWYGTVPDNLQPTLKRVIDSISDKPEIDDEDFSSVVKSIHELIPPYTYYHYRLLHTEVQDASKSSYIGKDYYKAIQEALKRYKNAVKSKSGVTADEDLAIVSAAFGKNKPLETTAKHKIRPNGDPFSSSTLENIEEGQLALSRGIISGGRNVLSHEEHQDLMNSGLFTEKDCLDLLGLLSHLFKRLDEAEKRT